MSRGRSDVSFSLEFYLWYNCYLNNPIHFILKEVISLFDILQLIAVGDQRGGIDFACFD
jgi:hypothetical protein